MPAVPSARCIGPTILVPVWLVGQTEYMPLGAGEQCVRVTKSFTGHSGCGCCTREGIPTTDEGDPQCRESSSPPTLPRDRRRSGAARRARPLRSPQHRTRRRTARRAPHLGDQGRGERGAGRAAGPHLVPGAGRPQPRRAQPGRAGSRERWRGAEPNGHGGRGAHKRWAAHGVPRTLVNPRPSAIESSIRPPAGVILQRGAARAQANRVLRACRLSRRGVARCEPAPTRAALAAVARAPSMASVAPSRSARGARSCPP